MTIFERHKNTNILSAVSKNNGICIMISTTKNVAVFIETQTSERLKRNIQILDYCRW